METSFYMQKITADRSLLLEEQEALEGQTLLSIETCDDLSQDDFYVYSLEHPAEWLTVLRSLSLEQQEMLLSYYCLSKTQLILGRILGSTQTVCSFRIRMAIKVAGCFVMLGGPPTVEWMHKILLKAGYENKLKKAPLSEMIALYAQCQSFEQVAGKFKVKNRPDVRRTMSRAAKYLMRGDSLAKNNFFADGAQFDEGIALPEEIALGAYIFTLIDRANPNGQGISKRQRAKTARFVMFRDPKCVGEFRLRVEDPGFDAMFVSQANC